MKRQRVYLLVPALLVAMLALVAPVLAQAAGSSYIGQFNQIRTIASTVPHNGDINLTVWLSYKAL